MEGVLAVDFGTASARAAVFSAEGKPQALAGLDTTADSYLFPSVVSFSPDGAPVCGWEALRRRTAAPLAAVASVKRFLSPDAAALAAASGEHYFPFAVRVSGREVLIPQAGREWKPAEIASRILEKLKLAAEKKTGQTFRHAVMTLPAVFDETAAQVLVQSARAAGFTKVDLIAESSAAALAWTALRPEDGLLGIYNLGAGFFEAAIFERRAGAVRLIACEADTQIGGDDFSWQTAQYFLEDVGHPELAQDPVMMQYLYEEAERAKCALSHRGSCDIRITDPERKINYLKAFSRYELGTVIQPLVERTRDAVEKVLQRAGLDAAALPPWLPAGGPARMPIVREALRQMTGKMPEEAPNPDQLAVLGTCLHGAVLTGKIKIPRLEK